MYLPNFCGGNCCHFRYMHYLPIICVGYQCQLEALGKGPQVSTAYLNASRQCEQDYPTDDAFLFAADYSSYRATMFPALSKYVCGRAIEGCGSSVDMATFQHAMDQYLLAEWWSQSSITVYGVDEHLSAWQMWLDVWVTTPLGTVGGLLSLVAVYLVCKEHKQTRLAISGSHK